MPKKIFTILFISLIAFSQIGYYLIIHQARQEHKAHIKKLLHQNISENLLTAIDYTANKQAIYWEEEGEEFFFNGEIYDLVKTKNVAGKVYLYCINDEKENELINQYNSSVKNNSSTEKNIKSTFDNSFSPYLITNFAIIYPKEDSNKQYPFSFSKIESAAIRPTLKPPPELFI